MSFEYEHGVLGGTFDHFHAGHKALLNTALRKSGKLSIGIADASLTLHKTLSEVIEDYNLRYRSISEFISAKKAESRAKLFHITDIYGTTLKDKTLDVIYATEETINKARHINKERNKIGLKDLAIELLPYEKSDDGRVITSQRIRWGEIDRKGRSYEVFLDRKALWKLPVTLRQRLRQPIGVLFKGTIKQKDKLTREIISYTNRIRPTLTVAVGDIIAGTLMETGFVPDISVIDFRSRRMEIGNSFFSKLKDDLINDPGSINRETAKALKLKIKSYSLTKEKEVLVIKGEEDLLTLPAILFSPLKSVVLYGQLDLGVVLVEVTEEKKAYVRKLLQSFE